ncbi:BnaA10g06600D [Brassica napus]|uniref:BnaA10g06600D protein n=1 Tax=Brassica napus TaxID=3708 RepID=A0A078FIY0_BRANA|nr:BnaA10g06600D [Brassica napus]
MVRRDGDMIPFDLDSPYDFMEAPELIGSTSGWITSLVDGRSASLPSPSGHQRGDVLIFSRGRVPCCGCQVLGTSTQHIGHVSHCRIWRPPCWIMGSPQTQGHTKDSETPISKPSGAEQGQTGASNGNKSFNGLQDRRGR